MMRLFIAVNLSEEVKNRIGGLIKKLSANWSQIKWVIPQNLHITLKFLGWVPDDRVNEIISKVKETVCNYSSFEVSFGGTGAFPGGKSPRVFWVGIEDGAGKIAMLAECLEKKFSELGFKGGESPFNSHVTIGRAKESKKKKINKNEIEKLGKELEKSGKDFFGKMLFDRVSIFKSTLTPGGPIYEAVGEIKLRQSGK